MPDVLTLAEAAKALRLRRGEARPRPGGLHRRRGEGLLAATGARIGELSQLRCSAWDGYLLHLDGKTGPRAFPLTIK